MSHAISFWKRLSHMVRGNGHAAAARAGLHASDGLNGAAAEEHEHPAGDGPQQAGHDGNGHALASARRGWLTRSGDHERVMQLVDAMHAHFERQDRRSEELAVSVDRVASTLSRLAEAQQVQSDHLSSMVGHVCQTREHAAALAASLREMPASIQSQAELARLVGRHMESAGRTNGQLVDSLQRFGQAAETLRDSGAAQFETMQRLHASDQEQRQTLVTFIHVQNRRFLVGAVIAAALGIGTLITLVITLVTLLGR